MQIDVVIKIAVIGIMIAIINQILSKLGRDEFAMITTLAGLIVILMILLPYILELFTSIQSILDF